jgi:tetratricopeptide (TPR) repeat protein
MKMESRSTACPGPEELAAFVDRRLTRAARGSIELHLADCDVCRELLADVGLLSREPLPNARWVVSKRAVGAAALGLAASLVLVLRLAPGALPSGGPDPHAELVDAVGEFRTVEGRLTGGFAFGPLRPIMRSGSNAQGEENFRVLAAVAALEERAETSPTAANRHAAGVGQLVVGAYERAVATLEAAVDEAPSRAAYHSDLAAAYLARGRYLDRRDDFERARRSAERAIDLDNRLSEAYFNRALALDALGEAADAERAYRTALAVDARSPWNAEINTRLQQLMRP